MKNKDIYLIFEDRHDDGYESVAELVSVTDDIDRYCRCLLSKITLPLTEKSWWALQDLIHWHTVNAHSIIGVECIAGQIMNFSSIAVIIGGKRFEDTIYRLTDNNANTIVKPEMSEERAEIERVIKYVTTN